MESTPHANKGPLWALSLTALGVVYGDIGTSPLYSIRECFHGLHSIPLSEHNVLGVLSLIVWALIIVISIKYILFVLRADNRGEGGILALTTLAIPKGLTGRGSWILVSMGLFGAALLYGDGVITPAISVLSAVEGLKVATPLFEPYILPFTILVLTGLFFFQRFGTARIGTIFGPIILLWFFVLGALGIHGILENPHVLAAALPFYAYEFLIENHTTGFLVLGAVFLVITGGEAMYADMGHFGKKPIRLAWFTVALPGLLLNYFGQGALLLNHPEASENPFYYLVPSWGLYPMVILSTIATVIASQALISGVFSLTRQAILLGYCPRLNIVHTSSSEIGQIYLPDVNWVLFLATVWTVLSFKSSTNLAAAYGVAVSTTIVITTILLGLVARRLWRWNLMAVVGLTSIFLIVDLAFWGANIIKLHQGGWFPLLLGTIVFTCMATWRKGRLILADRMRRTNVPIQDFINRVSNDGTIRIPGSAVFMVGDPQTTPPAMLHNVRHNKVLHQQVLILTVVTKEASHIPLKERIEVHTLGNNFYRVIAYYGFMDNPDVVDIIKGCQTVGIDVELKNITFFLGRETLIATQTPGMAIWREHLFAFMSRNAQRATSFFNIPADQVVEVGMVVEL